MALQTDPAEWSTHGHHHQYQRNLPIYRCFAAASSRSAAGRRRSRASIKGKEHKKHKKHKKVRSFLCFLCFLCSFPFIEARDRRRPAADLLLAAAKHL